MPKANTPAPLAAALFRGAKQYHLAANTLHDSGNHKAMEDPLYFLFAHTIELALKAFARIHGGPFKAIHDLDKLLADAQKFGLVVSSSTSDAIKNLKSENDVHGFRYFVFASAIRTEITWLRQGVDELMTTVQTVLGKLTPEKENGIVFKGSIKIEPKSSK